MSVLDRFRGSRQKPSAESLTFHVEKESEAFTGSDGVTIWGSGYTLVDAVTGSYMKLYDQHFENSHCLVCHIAGVTYRSDALQDDRFSPGRPLLLRPEPTNPHDRNAVGVWDATGAIQVGFVPREYSERVATDIASGNQLAALTLREFRRSESGPRFSIHILIVPVGRHQFVIDVDHDPNTREDDFPGERLDTFIDAQASALV